MLFFVRMEIKENSALCFVLEIVVFPIITVSYHKISLSKLIWKILVDEYVHHA